MASRSGVPIGAALFAEELCSFSFNSDDVRQFVVRREVKEGKKSKAPKIQRLITPQLLQRKRYFKALTRKRMEAGKEAKAAYQKRLSEYHHEQKEKRAAELQKKKAKKGAAE
eukprot:g30336.t1